MPDLNISVEDLYTELRRRILNGEYAAGVKLSENKLAKEFRLSRMPVRESFKHLEQDGLLTILPKSGSYVRAQSPLEVKEILEVRTFLEALAIRLVIEQKVEPCPLEACLKQMEVLLAAEPFDTVSFGELHFRFHRTLVQMAGNEVLCDIYDKMRFRSMRQVFFSPMTPSEQKMTHNEHKKIIDLIRAKDPVQAEQFIINHLWKRKRKNLIELIERQTSAALL
ncbi:transcriptional regulator, GntR family [Treponema lecithinolyticum ATCC 700332]|uniref:Transcriptional regulator, GntR family n=1 Tax=Treponema lecithinolyticum ATCC 700332 TaxID=1321815 RepID=A0ABN0NXM0_TRELE|nr:transcriptional regulator, GntR family [Treponema lecithinolyticum ATCC 700332]